MWALVSANHRILEGRRRYFEITSGEEELGDALGVLSGWVDRSRPLAAEVGEVSYLLGVIIETSDASLRSEATVLVVEYIESLAP
jgi:hypothetical protein